MDSRDTNKRKAEDDQSGDERKESHKKPKGVQSSSSKASSLVDSLPDIIHIESREKTELPPSDGRDAYEPYEHTDIGNLAFHLFVNELQEVKEESENEILKNLFETEILKEKKLDEREQKGIYHPSYGKQFVIPLYQVKLSNGLELTLGEIVALAGDFIGIPSKPIAFGKTPEEQEERFQKSYELLKASGANAAKLKDVVDHMRTEAVTKRPHNHWDIRFIKQYMINKIPNGNNLMYAYKMSDSAKSICHSPYFKLGFTNFDHFHEEAREAFLAGHRVALKQMAEARRVAQDSSMSVEERAKRQTELLREALLMELFACHFLTDLFAGGHVRVPRKQILNHVTTSTAESKTTVNATPSMDNISDFNLAVAGFFAKKMHDEDGERGVWVKTTSSSPWLARGDGNYYSKENKENAEKACHTVKEALHDLVRAYKGIKPKLDRDHLDEYVPREDIGKHVEEVKKNIDGKGCKPPLFTVKDNQLLCRENTRETISTQGVVQGVQSAVVDTSLRIGMHLSQFFIVKTNSVSSSTQNELGIAQETEQLVELDPDNAEELYGNIKKSRVGCIVS